ncbi:DUF2264 domain-containing protein [Hamadaea sp. NPDC051192]|uniref:DUF2264 domain-containing protein n=1 Tax=Hamadaea sp. NPDC051192 TaxID=3154940 RepID=UPI00343216B3
MSALPDPDRLLSPHTGYSRAHWEAVADRMLLAVRDHAAPGHSLIDLPGPASNSGRWSDGLEGFARTFLLAAMRVRGADGQDPHGLLDWYASGVAAGSDPRGRHRWPTLGERRQARVEAASLAIALHETRPWLWDRLGDDVKANVVDWFTPIVGTSDYDNNWIWFQNIVEAFLRSVDGPWSKEDIERNLATHESWYVGGGWYSDGGSGDDRRQNFDYYSGWAMHFYPLWFSRITGEEPNPQYRSRLSEFLADAQYLVGADGRPLFQGRSLTYRFAMLAPFWMGALFDATPLEPGVTRGLASSVLQHFLEAGSVDAGGLLPIGWHGPFPRIRQQYTGPGSPYWASKGFAGLLLPPDHPVWTAPESATPVAAADKVFVIPEAGWVVSATAADGVVRVANHGSDHLADRRAALDDPFYLRHAYATHAAPDLSAEAIRGPLDSHVALLDDAGEPSHRGRIERIGQGDRWAASYSRAMWLDLSPAGGLAAGWHAVRTGPWLATASVLHGAVEVRLVRVGDDTVRLAAGGEDPEAYWPVDPGPWRLHLGGWALAGDSLEHRHDGGQAAVTRPDGFVSEVRALRGFDEAGVTGHHDANPFGPESAVPWLRTTIPVEPGALYAAAVILRGPGTTPALPTIVATPTTAVEVRWPDGSVDLVDLT